MASTSSNSSRLIWTRRTYVAMPRSSTTGSTISASVVVCGPNPVASASRASAMIDADNTVRKTVARLIASFQINDRVAIRLQCSLERIAAASGPNGRSPAPPAVVVNESPSAGFCGRCTVVPLPQGVPGALVVLEERPPAEVLPGRRKREAHAAPAEFGVGLLDVRAVEEQVRVRERIGYGPPRFVAPRAQHQHQVLERWLHLNPSFVAVGVVADSGEPHGGGPELQRRLLVLDRHHDLGHVADHLSSPFC